MDLTPGAILDHQVLALLHQENLITLNERSYELPGQSATVEGKNYREFRLTENGYAVGRVEHDKSLFDEFATDEAALQELQELANWVGGIRLVNIAEHRLRRIKLSCMPLELVDDARVVSLSQDYGARSLSYLSYLALKDVAMMVLAGEVHRAEAGGGDVGRNGRFERAISTRWVHVEKLGSTVLVLGVDY